MTSYATIKMLSDIHKASDSYPIRKAKRKESALHFFRHSFSNVPTSASGLAWDYKSDRALSVVSIYAGGVFGKTPSCDEVMLTLVGEL